MEIRELECRLTPEDIRAKEAAIADAFEERERLCAAMRSVSAHRRDEIGTVERKIRRLSEERRSGFELRDVEVEERRDYRRGTVTIVRLDTGDVVEKRDLTDEERRVELPFSKQAK
jgi:hypothetical protein